MTTELRETAFAKREWSGVSPESSATIWRKLKEDIYFFQKVRPCAYEYMYFSNY